MIDKAVFANGMGVLAGTFSRTVDEPIHRAYYLVLSRELETPEFEQAVALAVQSLTFWPTPRQLIDLVKPRSDALQALAETEALVWQHGGYQHFPAVEYAKLPLPVKAGLKAAGGLAALRSAEGDKRGWLERRFVEAYDEAVEQVRALPIGNADRQLPAGSR